jgi:hypothetical protein
MAHIPQAFDDSLTAPQTDNKDFPPPYIFDDGATVNFKVHKVEERITERKGSVNLPDCEMWSFQLIINDGTGNSNMVFCDVIKDGRVWHLKDKNGKLWVQNKFLNLCTGMGLRESKQQLNLNPAWFTDASFFTDVIGQLKVSKKVAEYGKRAGQFVNEVNWFIDAPVDKQAPHQQGIGLEPANGATVSPFSTDANADSVDGIPF